MNFLLAIFFLVAVIITGINVRSGFSQSTQRQEITSEKVSGSSRSDIRQMLQQIVDKAAPERVYGAMCYKPAAAAVCTEYVCPLDGEKTSYKGEEGFPYRILKDIEEMRRFVKKLNGSTDLAIFKLDESRLCAICSPGLGPEERYVSLITAYPDGTEHRCAKVGMEDLRFLEAFVNKKLAYTTPNDGQEPLKDQLPRLKELLGIDSPREGNDER